MIASATAHAPMLQPMPKQLRRQDLVRLLSSSLGQEKAGQLIVQAAAALEMPTFSFSLLQATEILERLRAEPGIIGITAQLALARLPRLFRSLS